MGNDRGPRFGIGTREGFTLLEVLIAMAIMAMTFTSILSVESNSIFATARSRRMNIVGMLARNKMIETELSFEGKTFDEYQKEKTGKFTPPFDEYSWAVAVKEIKFPNLTPPANNGDAVSDVSSQITKVLTNYLSKSLREVDVSVLWKDGSKERSFTISTYWVDLNHEFNPTDQ